MNTSLMRSSGTLMLLIGVLVFTSVATAQDVTGEIRGTITDVERGDALIGANVVVDGTNFGSASNLDGTYSIKGVPPGSYTVTARFVGYRLMSHSVTVSAGATVTQDFALSVSAVRMDEVVVTGQGTAIERRKLASPIETITAREIALAPVTSIDQLLQGRVPGMVSLTSSGQPGTGGRIRSRGVRSALSSQTPVIFVDGVRVDNQDNYRSARGSGGLVSSSLADILTGDIERVEVIKGGAASTLYGSDAANGVIQIFTKKGYAGIPKWTFTTTQGIDVPETRWVREPFTKDKVMKNGGFQSYTVGVTGGTDVATYSLGGRMQSAEGVVQKNNSKLYSMSGGMRSTVGEKTTIEFSAAYTNSRFGGMYNNNAIASPLGSTEDSTIQSSPNPDSTLRIAFLPDLTEFVNRFTSGLTTRYNPLSFLTTRATVGIDYRKNEQRQFNPIEAAGWTSTPGGGLFRSDRDYLQISLDAAVTLSYPKEGDLTSTLTAGVQGFREEDRQSQATGTNFPVPGTDDFDNAATVSASESNQQLFQGGFYFQENIGIFNRIFVDLGIRMDGNSAFGKDVGMQSYPKAGIAYNISDEPMFSELLGPINEYFNSLKLRASWGVTGKFPPAFTRDRTFLANRFLNVGLISFSAFGNPDLKPEKTTTFEFGFDAGFLGDRISIQVSQFYETTKDALFTVGLEPTTGFANKLANVGEIQNSGFEFSIDAIPVSTPDVDWSIRFSYATLFNKVISLGGSAPFNIGGFAFLPQRIEEGYPIGVFRLNVPTGGGAFNANVLDRKYSPTPKYTGSISTSVTLFRDIRITAVGDYAYGHYVLNTGAVIRYFSGLSPEINRVPAGYNFTTASSVWVEKGDFFKLREISARYQVPAEYYEGFNLRGLAVNLSFRNIFTITPSKEFDPELHGVRAGRALDVGGINFFTLSAPFETRFGLEVNL